MKSPLACFTIAPDRTMRRIASMSALIETRAHAPRRRWARSAAVLRTYRRLFARSHRCLRDRLQER
jgi:hypothetical protein